MTHNFTNKRSIYIFRSFRMWYSYVLVLALILHVRGAANQQVSSEEDEQIGEVFTQGQVLENKSYETFDNQSLPCSARYVIPYSTIEWQVEVYRVVLPIMLTLCLLSFVANCYMLLSIKYIRRIQSPTLCFSISLAAANAVASIVLALGLLINSYLFVIHRVTFDHVMCYILVLEAVRNGGMLTNVMHLLALSINHYIGIVKPLQYASIVTKRAALIVIGVSWVLPTLTILLHFSLRPNTAFRSPECENYQFLFQFSYRISTVFIFFLFLAAMCFFYAHIFMIVKRHHLGLKQFSRSGGSSGGSRSQQEKDMTSNLKAVVTTLLILGTYVLGWMPAAIQYILYCEDCLFCFQTHYQMNIVITISVNCLMIFKYLVDPIIYCMRIRDIQEGLRRMHFELCAIGQPPANIHLGSRGTSTYISSLRSTMRARLGPASSKDPGARRATVARYRSSMSCTPPACTTTQTATTSNGFLCPGSWQYARANSYAGMASVCDDTASRDSKPGGGLLTRLTHDKKLYTSLPSCVITKPTDSIESTSTNQNPHSHDNI